MTSKFARNAPCPCGSGRKYKFCHGSPAETGAAGVRTVEMQYRFDSIILSPETSGGETRIVVNGELAAGPNDRFPFLLIVRPLDDGGLQIQQLGWQRVPPIADKEAVARQLLRYLGECLELLALCARPGEQPGAIAWQPPRSAEEAESAHCVFLRPRLARLPGPAWPTLWDRISLKLRGDPAFAVTGFTLEEVETAFARLRPIFTSEWLERVFREALDAGAEISMSSELPHEASAAWFPAFHLSRLANGVICRDPALNTLVDLGLALGELEGFTGLDALCEALAEAPQLHHQAVLAAELFRKGCLSAFAGGEHGDLQVIVDDRSCLLRSFEARLDTLLDDLRPRLDVGDTSLPVVLHAVVCESSWHQPEQDLAAALEQVVLPEGVVALVIGDRFLDADGGRLKRRARRIVHNADAEVQGVDIERLFAANHETWREPALNVGSYFYVL